MDEGNTQFAKELIKVFGEDRFYHGMWRAGVAMYAGQIYKACHGGDDSGWERLRSELRMPNPGLHPLPHPSTGADSVYEALCKTAFTISSHYKEFAGRSPALPASVHARMVLDHQNEWTRKYAENLTRHMEGK